MKVYNNNQLYKSPAGDQLWNSGRQDWIFGRIGDQEGTISDPVSPQVGGPARGEESLVTRLNFKTSRVGVYKCLSLIVGFAVTVAIWPREVVSCRDFILRAVATFLAMSLVGIYPGRA